MEQLKADSFPANRCDLIYMGRRPRGLLVEAAPLVPDKTVCNPINYFKRGRAALIDTWLGFFVSGLLNPSSQRTPTGALTQRKKEKGGAFINLHSRGPGPTFTKTLQPQQQRVSLSLEATAPVCTAQPNAKVNWWHTTVKRMWSY